MHLVSTPSIVPYSSPENTIKHIAMNKDVYTEILLHLPVQSLLRFRLVCKLWGYIIDSTSFRKLHVDNNNSNDVNKSNDMVYLHLYSYKRQIQVLRNQKLLISYKSDHFKCFDFAHYDDQLLFDPYENGFRFYGPVNGLICIYGTQLNTTIAIFNPCIGQLKLLPTTSYPNSCVILNREVAIGFDDDYKVVQLLFCTRHNRLHGLLYSRKTDCWRDLSGLIADLHIYSVSPMKSGCENGHFAYWHVSSFYNGLILILDMKNEVFRTITLPHLPYHCNSAEKISTYFAEDEHSFWRFDLPRSSHDKVRIYRSSFSECRYQGMIMFWNDVMNVKTPRWRLTDCVVLNCWKNVFMYDNRARRYDYCEQMYDASRLPILFKHRLSFVSL